MVINLRRAALLTTASTGVALLYGLASQGPVLLQELGEWAVAEVVASYLLAIPPLALWFLVYRTNPDLTITRSFRQLAWIALAVCIVVRIQPLLEEFYRIATHTQLTYGTTIADQFAGWVRSPEAGAFLAILRRQLDWLPQILLLVALARLKSDEDGVRNAPSKTLRRWALLACISVLVHTILVSAPALSFIVHFDEYYAESGASFFGAIPSRWDLFFRFLVRLLLNLCYLVPPLVVYEGSCQEDVTHSPPSN